MDKFWRTPRSGSQERSKASAQADLAFEAQLAAPPREARCRNAVSEHVMHPTEVSRVRRDGELGLDQPLVVAVARAKHHAMLAKGDRLPVAVGCDMTH